MELPIKIREYSSSDEAFVFHSWLKTYFDALIDMKMTNGIRSDVYYKGQHNRVAGLLKRGNTLIACNSEDDDQIYGWLNFEDTEDDGVILHFVYVKQPFRKMGIAKRLIEIAKYSKGEVFYTHKTQFTKNLTNVVGKATFNPYLLEDSYEN